MQRQLLNIIKDFKPNMLHHEIVELAKILKHYIEFEKRLDFNKNIITQLEKNKSRTSKMILFLKRKNNISEAELINLFHNLEKTSRVNFVDFLLSQREFNHESASLQLEKLVIAILGSRSSILDYCSGEGAFLMHYASKYSNSSLYGIEILNSAFMSSQINLDLMGSKFQILNEDALDDNTFFKENLEFDAIFSNFPINLIDRERKTNLQRRSYFNKHQFKHYPIRDYNWLFAMHVVNLLSEQGKAVVLAPLNMLFRESQIHIRNEFLEKGLIETIIQLPEKTLNYTSIPMALMILSNHNEKIRLVDATDAFEPSRRVNYLQVDKILSRLETDGEFSKTITNLELIQNHVSWLPRNILLNDAFDYEGEPLENVIQDIFRGAQIKRSDYKTMKERLKDTPYTKYQMVSLSSFDESIDPDRLETIYTPKAMYDRYILKNHDILLTSRGTLFKLGLVELETEDLLIATGNVAVLRVDATKINPIYLYMFLKSTKGERLLESIRKGSSILVINNKDVLDLKIPAIPLGKQEALAEKYMRLKEQKTLIQKRLNRMDEDITALYDVAGDI